MKAVMKRIFWSKYRILLLLLGMTATLYILFLYYSMSRLDAVNSNSFTLDHNVNEEILQDKLPEMPEFSVVARMQQSILKPKSLIRGVFLDKMHLYLPTQNNTFQCLHTKQQIPYEYLNDDFCDCNDNSDEPGTSACQSSKFYCTFQLEGLKAQFTWSSHVRDGICDCCDGSDEWATELLPDKIRIKDPSLGGAVMHAPCANWCTTILQKVRRKKMLTLEGLKHKVPYLKAAINLKDKKNFGPEGVFFKLSLECFQIQIPPYDYNICPFKKCTQQKFPQPVISLGYKPIWEKMRPGSYILKMTGGNAQYCPNNKERISRITFECGVLDNVKSIQEDVCEYSILFNTPAAC